MFFAWRISDDNGFLVDHKDLLYIKITHYHIDNKNGIVHHELNIDSVRCNNTRINNKIFDKSYRSDSWYCIDWEKYDNLTFGGFWDNSELSYFDLQIYSCKNNYFAEGECTTFDDLKS